MDPFSLTVGAIGLLGALAKCSKLVHKLVKLRNVAPELLQLANEVSDLESTIAKTDAIIKHLSSEEGSSAYTDTLKRLKGRAIIPVDTLRSLLNDLIRDYEGLDSATPGTVEFSKWTWLRKQGEAKRLQEQLRTVTNDISKELIQASSWAVLKTLQFSTELREIRSTTTKLYSILQPPVHIATDVIEPVLISDGNSTTSTPIPSTPSSTAGVVAVTSDSHLLQSPIDHFDDNNSRRNVQLMTSTFMSRPCRVRLCTCRCHKASSTQPLAWVSTIFGSLFLNYSGVSLPFNTMTKCTERACQREEKGLISANYYFPSWAPFAPRMVSLMKTWNDFGGPQLHVKFPRVIPPASELFVLTQKGNIPGVQRLFSDKKASPYDISAGEGRSALHFALTANQPEMARFLIENMADVRLIDNYSLSPIDTLWNYILEDAEKPEYIAFKQAFGKVLDETSDLQKRNFSHVHLIVNGLSRLNLDDYLQVSTAHIDALCSLGRSPLCWAAQNPQKSTVVKTLVSYGAAVHLSDIRGQTPIHLAAETGDYRSLAILLTTASKLDDSKNSLREVCDGITTVEIEEFNRDPDQFSSPPFVGNLCQRLLADTDYKGRTAIHFAARMNRVRHANLLLWYGANVDHPDAIGRTPLHIALYWNHHEFIRFLLEKGARFDVVDDNKMTVLHYVAMYGDEETMELLSNAKIQLVGPNCRDGQGYTPLETFEKVRPLIMSESVSTSQRSQALFDTLLRHAAI